MRRASIAVLLALTLAGRLGAEGSVTQPVPTPSPSPPVAAPAQAAAATTPQPAAPNIRPLVETDPIALIGWTLDQAYQAAGAPAQVFAYRGQEAWQDDVVFYYPGGVYLFWYRNRVWQVRVDTGYAGTLLGLRLGDPRDRVISVIARSYQEVEGSLVFLLPDASLVDLGNGNGKGPYPLRLRAFFRDDKLSDLYLYRGDF